MKDKRKDKCACFFDLFFLAKIDAGTIRNFTLVAANCFLFLFYSFSKGADFNYTFFKQSKKITLRWNYFFTLRHWKEVLSRKWKKQTYFKLGVEGTTLTTENYSKMFKFSNLARYQFIKYSYNGDLYIKIIWLSFLFPKNIFLRKITKFVPSLVFLKIRPSDWFNMKSLECKK